MELREVLEIVTDIDCKSVCINDVALNPIEIILLTHSSDKLKNKFTEKGVPRFVEENGKRRFLRIVSYKNLGIAKWEEDLWKRGQEYVQYVRLACASDLEAFQLYYVLLCEQRECWIKKNVLNVLQERKKCDRETLEKNLADYLVKNNYQVRIQRIVSIPKAIHNIMSPLEKCILSFRLLKMKIERKARFIYLKIKSFLHTHLNSKKYLRYLRENCIVKGDFEVLNGQVSGSSGCTMIKEFTDEKVLFVKGNEIKEYHGIENEIRTLKKLSTHSEGDESWYLPMVEYDEEEKWIKYPFVTWGTLKEKIKKAQLSGKEIEDLGAFLVYALDKMYELHIVHNDLRMENIMVTGSENGGNISFMISDFGCASVDGSFPWGNRDYWGNYFSGIVCGDYRYNENIVDDAAAAYGIYLLVGGKTTDMYAQMIRERIGRLYFEKEVSNEF